MPGLISMLLFLAAYTLGWEASLNWNRDMPSE